MMSKAIVLLLVVSLAAAVLGQPFSNGEDDDITHPLLRRAIDRIEAHTASLTGPIVPPIIGDDRLILVHTTDTPVDVDAAGKAFAVSPWALNQNYEGEWSTTVGNSVTFIWPQGLHSVFKIDSGNCPSSWDNQEQIAPPSQGGQAIYTFENPGVYWFACSVDDHCNLGMKVKFTVT